MTKTVEISWCDLPMIFTSDEITSGVSACLCHIIRKKRQKALTNDFTPDQKESLFMVTHALFYIHVELT